MHAHRLLRAWLVAACSAFPATAAVGDEEAAWRALRQDGAIALVRHAEAPGVGDPAGWTLGDCPTQRNLSDAGRAQARALGARLRAARIAVARLAASPWCRTVETAELLGAGSVEVDPAFANAYVLSDRRDAIAAEARAVLARWRGPGALVVVTHGENIAALVGRAPATAELLVVAAGRDGTVREIAAVQTPSRR
jgi:broad specificity phosphatase PhoE